ncbi:hypothetical protein IAT40_000824 [Kwoniella sp. CBS 6097]
MPGLQVIANGLRRVRSAEPESSTAPISEKEGISVQRTCPSSPAHSSSSLVDPDAAETEIAQEELDREERLRIQAMVNPIIDYITATIDRRDQAQAVGDRQAVALCDEQIIRALQYHADVVESLSPERAAKSRAVAKAYAKANMRDRHKMARKIGKQVLKVVVVKVISLLVGSALSSIGVN